MPSTGGTLEGGAWAKSCVRRPTRGGSYGTRNKADATGHADRGAQTARTGGETDLRPPAVGQVPTLLLCSEMMTTEPSRGQLHHFVNTSGKDSDLASEWTSPKVCGGTRSIF